jgi:hypothetical protein
MEESKMFIENLKIEIKVSQSNNMTIFEPRCNELNKRTEMLANRIDDIGRLIEEEKKRKC